MNFKILLCHNPDARKDIKNETKIDLTLCGHTHGGQVAIPFISHHFISIKDPVRYQAGLIKEPYGYTYVNRGIGTLVFPFRIGVPPEITYFTLQKDGSEKNSGEDLRKLLQVHEKDDPSDKILAYFAPDETKHPEKLVQSRYMDQDILKNKK